VPQNGVCGVGTARFHSRGNDNCKVWGEVYNRWFRLNGGRGRRSLFGGSHVVSLATNRSLLILCQIKRGFRGAELDDAGHAPRWDTANCDALEALGNTYVAIVCPLVWKLRLRVGRSTTSIAGGDPNRSFASKAPLVSVSPPPKLDFWMSRPCELFICFAGALKPIVLAHHPRLEQRSLKGTGDRGCWVERQGGQ
jgi:hypothetical protein